MPRDFFINGESLVQVKGNTASRISSLSELGLSDGQIQVSIEMFDEDLNVNAGGRAPVDVQQMLGVATISITLIHYDNDVLEECVRLGFAGGGGNPADFSTLPRAGQRMGNNAARFAATNYWVGLNITSPVANKPYRFLFAKLANAIQIPLGNDKTIVSTTWRAIPYQRDPYGGGQGSTGAYIFDRTADV